MTITTLGKQVDSFTVGTKTITFTAPPVGSRIFVITSSDTATPLEPTGLPSGQVWTRHFDNAQSGIWKFALLSWLVTAPITSLSISYSGFRIGFEAFYTTGYEYSSTGKEDFLGTLGQDLINLPAKASLPSDDSYLIMVSTRTQSNDTEYTPTGFDLVMDGPSILMNACYDFMAAGSSTVTRSIFWNVTSSFRHGGTLFYLVPSSGPAPTQAVSKGVGYAVTETTPIYYERVSKGVNYIVTDLAIPGEERVSKGVGYVVTDINDVSQNVAKGVGYLVTNITAPSQAVAKSVSYLVISTAASGDMSVVNPPAGPAKAKWKLTAEYPFVRINDDRFSVFVTDPGVYTIYLMDQNGDVYNQTVNVTGAEDVLVPIIRNFNQIAMIKSAHSAALQDSVTRTMLARRVPSSSF